MSKVQSTPLAPPATAPPQEHVSRLDEQGGGVTIIVFLMGIVAWGFALVAITTADEARVPAQNYALGIAATIVGATLILAATIYDSRRRDD